MESQESIVPVPRSRDGVRYTPGRAIAALDSADTMSELP
jgi:hypothetical protein